MAKQTLMKPSQITSALTSLTPAGVVILSFMSKKTTPTTSSTTCALSVSEELISTLREVGEQNAQFPQKHSYVFANAVNVYRTAAQKVLARAAHRWVAVFI